ncbi:MAG: 30S ribosomal protein S18 [Dehalococcoidia bacterium]|jgi:small subunit ribosomal protein S18
MPGRKPTRPTSKTKGGRDVRGKSRKFVPKRKVCTFCAQHIAVIDYKDVPMLQRYISDRGKIEPRRRTGTCARHQRTLAEAIKRARHIALLPFTEDHIRESGRGNMRD